MKIGKMPCKESDFHKTAGYPALSHIPLGIKELPKREKRVVLKPRLGP